LTTKKKIGSFIHFLNNNCAFKMMKKIIFIYVILFPICSFGQTNLDSLWAIWNNHNQADTIRLEAIHKKRQLATSGLFICFQEGFRRHKPVRPALSEYINKIPI